MFEKIRDIFNEEIEVIERGREQLYKRRMEFINYYTPTHIPNMDIDEYVVGVEKPESKLNFCNSLERDLADLGNIIGSTAYKFGLYYGKTKSDKNREYRFVKKFGNDYLQAFENIKQEISKLLENCKTRDMQKIANCKVSPMFKSKIINTYYSDSFLNIHSNYHLDYYLKELDIILPHKIDPVYKREKLLKFKNKDIIMQNWTIDMFGYFLWDRYPKEQKK